MTHKKNIWPLSCEKQCSEHVCGHWKWLLCSQKCFVCRSHVLDLMLMFIVEKMPRYPEDTWNKCPKANIRITLKAGRCVHAGGGSSGCGALQTLWLGVKKEGLDRNRRVRCEGWRVLKVRQLRKQKEEVEKVGKDMLYLLISSRNRETGREAITAIVGINSDLTVFTAVAST